jgi:hypothetical protein
MRAPAAATRGALVGLGLALAAAACASPEATRMRAGGPGADVGNRSGDVRMHEGSEPYYRTPHLDGITGPSLEPASQARRLSRR